MKSIELQSIELIFKHSALKYRLFHLNPALSNMHFQIVIEQDISTEIFVASIPGISGANTQGDTVDEARSNLDEVIEFLRAENAMEAKNVN